MALRIIFIIFTLLIQFEQGKLDQDISDHLGQFAHLNSHGHDDIDDSPGSEAHHHVHRHSEDGEEHEHHHHHSQLIQHELKFFPEVKRIKTFSHLVDKCPIISKQSFISTPHPNEVFRPPIS